MIDESMESSPRQAVAHQVATAVHGHLLIAAAVGEGPCPLLVGFHGYGETAEDHFEQLMRIPGIENWTVCAAQGLRDFYRGRTGEVVAGWMTKLNRELAIQDNLRYVAAVVDKVWQEVPRCGGEPLVYAGFSQGVAMAYRAATRAERLAAGVIALAGDVPPELAEGDALDDFPLVLIGRGTKDEWYDDAKLRADVELLTGRGVTVETEVFEGGHEWTEPFLARAGEVLERVRTAENGE